MKFKSQAQRRAVMGGFHQKKADTMMTIKARWNKRNEEKLKRGEISKEKYNDEHKKLNDGTYDEYVENEAEFIVKHDIQLQPK